MAQAFVNDSKKIVEICREKKVSENVIEDIQEKYLEFLILASFNCCGMPKHTKVRLCRDVLLKIQKGSI